MKLLAKGIIFLLIWLLFISRLIPKYLTFRETNQVDLLGIVWEGNIALLVLLGVAAISIILLAIAIKNIKDYFSAAKN